MVLNKFTYVFMLHTHTHTHTHTLTLYQTFLTSFWLNNGDWKVVPGPFMISMK